MGKTHYQLEGEDEQVEFDFFKQSIPGGEFVKGHIHKEVHEPYDYTLMYGPPQKLSSTGSISMNVLAAIVEAVAQYKSPDEESNWIKE